MNDKGMPDLRINGERLISSIREMGAVGFDPETGEPSSIGNVSPEALARIENFLQKYHK